MLIDYDPELSDIMAGLLVDDGLDVISHACPANACVCAEKALATRPDLILVNIAQPSGWLANTHGWRCLKHLTSNPQTSHFAALGYTMLDAFSLHELGIDLRSEGLQVRPGVMNPGQLADEIARAVQAKKAA